MTDKVSSIYRYINVLSVHIPTIVSNNVVATL